LDPIFAYWDPKPTRRPAKISLRADVFSLKEDESKGSKLVRC
jgi:hypothetical protein